MIILERIKSIDIKNQLASLISIYSLLRIQLPQTNQNKTSKSTQKNMKYHFCSSGAFLFIFIILVTICLSIEAQTCNPSGKIVGKKPPPGQCNPENQSECCKKGKLYTTYKCSPPVSKRTKATLTINSFKKGGDGGGASECDNKFHSDNTRVVALSTGWFNNRKRCSHYITIHGNGRSVKAKVVDECDSTMGCDPDHDYQPPCPHNIVDASPAVWKALGVKESDRGEMQIFWSDA